MIGDWYKCDKHMTCDRYWHQASWNHFSTAIVGVSPSPLATIRKYQPWLNQVDQPWINHLLWVVKANGWLSQILGKIWNVEKHQLFTVIRFRPISSVINHDHHHRQHQHHQHQHFIAAPEPAGLRVNLGSLNNMVMQPCKHGGCCNWFMKLLSNMMGYDIVIMLV